MLSGATAPNASRQPNGHQKWGFLESKKKKSWKEVGWFRVLRFLWLPTALVASLLATGEMWAEWVECEGGESKSGSSALTLFRQPAKTATPSMHRRNIFA